MSASLEFLKLIPRDFARAHLVVSRGRIEEAEQLAVADTTSPAALWNVGARLGTPVMTTVVGGEEIAREIDAAYSKEAERAEAIALPVASKDSVDSLLEQADRDLLSTQGKAPVVRLADALLFEALGKHASDVHIQPLSDRTLVRYRVDGALHTVREISPALSAAVVSRIKVMGRMDIAERRVAQDGRATVTIGDRAIDLRISTFPTSYGERTVLRLLDQGQQLFELDALGMPAEVQRRYLACAQRANGLILVTGPTGSGKTTTLYSTLRRIASSELNVMTIEDPIEYELSTVGLSVSQAQVNTKKGITFATGLRHILRQDPDVVLVGEIRDVDTARMAIQSSLTGHVVFTTLHTNDAPSAVTRMIDLGVEPFLLAASLSAVLAQRLVRKRHVPCDGKGCPECFETGYLGRTGLYELIVVDEEFRRHIARNEDLTVLREAARRGGMRSLRGEGERLARERVTDLVEVERVVQEVP